MMNFRRRKTEASERFAERRRLEEAAPRLKERAPDVASLKLEVEEAHDTAGLSGSKHVRHIVVDRAPALFAIPCGDPSCQGGGYDVTSTIMRGLADHSERFEAHDHCNGSVGTASCRRTLHVTAIATYAPSK
ncbi:MAG TPA: hypothetical protein VGH28_16925 [Polyangiaceae bacterium]|jgi:hypothetical protein